ncbi:MAG: hypothetical protein AB7O62_16040 [Pirellulales bacterium]
MSQQELLTRFAFAALDQAYLDHWSQVLSVTGLLARIRQVAEIE